LPELLEQRLLAKLLTSALRKLQAWLQARKQNIAFCSGGMSPRDFCNFCWDLLLNRLANDLDQKVGRKVRTFSDGSKYSG